MDFAQPADCNPSPEPEEWRDLDDDPWADETTEMVVKTASQLGCNYDGNDLSYIPCFKCQHREICLDSLHDICSEEGLK